MKILPPDRDLLILAGRMQNGFKIYGKMWENRKLHIMQVMWRTATLTRWDWDKHSDWRAKAEWRKIKWQDPGNIKPYVRASKLCSHTKG